MNFHLGGGAIGYMPTKLGGGGAIMAKTQIIKIEIIKDDSGMLIDFERAMTNRVVPFC